MNRRHVLGMVGAALVSLLAVGADAFEGKAKATKPACVCCGATCACSACTCDEAANPGASRAGKDCDCCGDHSCCASSVKVKVTSTN